MRRRREGAHDRRQVERIEFVARLHPEEVEPRLLRERERSKIHRQFDSLAGCIQRDFGVDRGDHYEPARFVSVIADRTVADEYFAVTEKVEALYRSEEHTSELQSLMRTSYAAFCLKQ